jgi:DNA polymerase-3 subunit delta'
MYDWNFLGNEWAVALLKNHVINQRLRHAYLITGTRGIGRRTLALAFSKSINCSQPPASGLFCGQCRACTLLDRMQHPDLALVQSLPDSKNILVDQVRELQHTLSLSPYEANYRIALLLNFEEANPNASNALLKTLEEPPAKVILLLTAESPETLLPTIVSRCELLRLYPMPPDTLEKALSTRYNIPEYQSGLLARVSVGRPGYALQLYNNPEQLDRRSAWLDAHWTLLNANRIDRFAFVDNLNLQHKDKAKRAHNIREFSEMLQVWLSLWRDVLLRNTATAVPLTNTDHSNQVQLISENISLEQAHSVANQLELSLSLLRTNVNTRLLAEVLLLDMPRLQIKAEEF